MKTIIRTTTIAMLSLAAGFLSPVNAQVKYFIYAPTESAEFPGSTEDATYKPKGAEEVLSFSFAVQNDVSIGTSSTGKARFESVQLQFVGDLSVLPKLISKSTLGTSYSDLVIEGVTNGTLFMKLELKLCFIESIQLVGTEGDRAVYSVSIPFGAMRLTPYKLNPNGSTTEGAPVLWSVVKDSAEFSVN
jgi:hypothetical protein